MTPPPTRIPFLGITVMSDFILNEGVHEILRQLNDVGATSVAIAPTVTAPSAEGVGMFQPPDDAGSSPRLFDRALWGRHGLWVRSAPSFHPKASLYTDSPYAPRQPNELTDEYGSLIGDFIGAAVSGGLKVYFQINGIVPHGLRDEDRPKLPDGQLPVQRMADTGCLASPAIRAYNRAYVRDLLEAYPDVSGFRPDWPEYPCYKLDEVFQDFSPHVDNWAKTQGFDFGSIRQDVVRLYRALHE